MGWRYNTAAAAAAAAVSGNGGPVVGGQLSVKAEGLCLQGDRCRSVNHAEGLSVILRPCLNSNAALYVLSRAVLCSGADCCYQAEH